MRTTRWLIPFFRYPPTWVAGLLMVLWALWAITRFDPAPPAAVGIGSLAALAFGAWYGLFVLSGLVTREDMRWLSRVVDPEHERSIESDFRELDFERGVTQLGQVRDAFSGLARVIHARLNPGELTFDRYMQAAEGVYRASIQNLDEALIALRSVSAIDPLYVEGRLAELDEGAGDRSASGTEVALNTRIELRDRQLRRVDELLALNEESLTALGTTASALADTNTGAKGAPIDARAAIEDLETLARRAGQYAASGTAGREKERRT